MPAPTTPTVAPDDSTALAALDAVVVEPGVERPKRSDAARNFDALLEAARAAFAESGSAAPLEEVAKRAGVGIGTLYRNFPTRDDLIEAVYVGEVQAMVAAARDALAEPPWEGLVHWLHRFLAYVGTKRALVEGLNRDPMASPVFSQCRTAIHAAGAPLLARAQADGSARPDVAIEEVIRLVSGVAGVTFPDEASRDKVVALAVDALRAR
ncbi:TetR/AcrR family transcriptional regulator [Lapillicoccus jejuensis]|uniref:TetR family transcriptional regulator n=1 Tax=Lapillicoccus jejuensis TaxID=402171 RepID=A0A542E646_9MICO|nr:TetR/AcrR family transcriptional regulator [Lapillicoccus jejuensis]TQJ10798.1 TetR family transcriptional regulator [Lapillicoccus jejuensis]